MFLTFRTNPNAGGWLFNAWSPDVHTHPFKVQLDDFRDHRSGFRTFLHLVGPFLNMANWTLRKFYSRWTILVTAGEKIVINRKNRLQVSTPQPYLLPHLQLFFSRQYLDAVAFALLPGPVPRVGGAILKDVGWPLL